MEGNICKCTDKHVSKFVTGLKTVLKDWEYMPIVQVESQPSAATWQRSSLL